MLINVNVKKTRIRGTKSICDELIRGLSGKF